jgi:hypothetical protein
MTSQDDSEILPPDIGALSQEQQEHDVGDAATEVSKILAAQHDSLMAKPGVTMIGETLDLVGRPAIMIGVKTAKDLAGLPESIEGVPVVAQVIGEVDAL